MAVSHTLSHAVTIPTGKRQISPLIRAPRVEVSPSSSSTEIGDSPAPTVRRTRTGRPKVKTGCITCKIRRVKCDETKPECERCTSTGRKCDGYVTHPPKRAAPKSKTNDQLVFYSGIDWEQGSFAERRAIDFFRSRTAPNISGYFDSDFWNCFVVQVSQSEPAVRHALAAVGALNERLDVYVQNMKHNISAIHIVPQPHTLASISSNRRNEHNDPFALAQYNKAIKHLANQMKQPSPASVDTTLLLSVLFVCVECLRGDYQPALKHFQAGMSVALASNGGKSFNSPGSPSSSIRDRVTPFLNRLELLSMLFGICPDYDYGLAPSETVPSSFATILEARDSLVHIMNLSTRFIRHTKELRYTNGITAEDILHYSKLLACLRDWKRTLDTYLCTQTPTPHLAEAAATLEIHQLAALTWLNRSLTNRESATDADIPLYERAVYLAESLQQSTTPQTSQTTPSQPSTFLFDMEFVSPLYLCAMKCRHALIRRRAIAALRRCTRREGLWDSQKAAAIAERIAEVEEEGMEVLDGSVLPSEERRVHFCHIDSKPGVDPTGHGLTFHALPEGPEGGWRVWTEVLVLG